MRPAKINWVMKAVQSVKNGMKWDERTFKVRKRLKRKKEGGDGGMQTWQGVARCAHLSCLKCLHRLILAYSCHAWLSWLTLSDMYNPATLESAVPVRFSRGVFRQNHWRVNELCSLKLTKLVISIWSNFHQDKFWNGHNQELAWSIRG